MLDHPVPVVELDYIATCVVAQRTSFITVIPKFNYFRYYRFYIVINQQAEVYATTNVGVQGYDLANIGPLLALPDAAYEIGVTNLSGKFAVGIGAAQDTGTWVPAA